LTSVLELDTSNARWINFHHFVQFSLSFLLGLDEVESQLFLKGIPVVALIFRESGIIMSQSKGSDIVGYLQYPELFL
jgi:hypothetical protein